MCLFVKNEPVQTSHAPWAGARESTNGIGNGSVKAGGRRSVAGSTWGGDGGGDAISGWGVEQSRVAKRGVSFAAARVGALEVRACV